MRILAVFSRLDCVPGPSCSHDERDLSEQRSFLERRACGPSSVHVYLKD